MSKIDCPPPLPRRPLPPPDPNLPFDGTGAIVGRIRAIPLIGCGGAAALVPRGSAGPEKAELIPRPPPEARTVPPRQEHAAPPDPITIPEPSSAALLVVAAMGWWLCSRNR